MSTSSAISKILPFSYDNIDNGLVVVSISLDFSTAFDCVDHKILLEKIFYYGVRGVALSWFRSYLSKRQQYVSINDKISERRLIDCGVPQGSILGPLLFLIFINDFPNSSSFFKFTLFADDSTLTCSFKNIPTERIANIINKELTLVNKWLKANKIKVNVSKANTSHFLIENSFCFPTYNLTQKISK